MLLMLGVNVRNIFPHENFATSCWSSDFQNLFMCLPKDKYSAATIEGDIFFIKISGFMCITNI